MKKIVFRQEAIHLARIQRKQNRTIVVVGGCFDLLHQGHIAFLNAAKNYGDVLFIFLESDESVKMRKGDKRPKENQLTRATKLLALRSVDIVLLLQGILTDDDYEKLVTSIKPAIIATTKGDPFRLYKERQAKKIGANVVDVIERIPDYSTTNLLINRYYE